MGGSGNRAALTHLLQLILGWAAFGGGMATAWDQGMQQRFGRGLERDRFEPILTDAAEDAYVSFVVRGLGDTF